MKSAKKAICEECGNEPANAIGFVMRPSPLAEDSNWSIVGDCQNEHIIYWVPISVLNSRSDRRRLGDYVQYMATKVWFKPIDFFSTFYRFLLEEYSHDYEHAPFNGWPQLDARRKAMRANVEKASAVVNEGERE